MEDFRYICRLYKLFGRGGGRILITMLARLDIILRLEHRGVAVESLRVVPEIKCLARGSAPMLHVAAVSTTQPHDELACRKADL